MNHSAQLRTGAYDQGLSARKPIAISRGELPPMNHSEACGARQISRDLTGNPHEAKTPHRDSERYGFKANIDQLYLWTEEESTRYLLHNIFCLR